MRLWAIGFYCVLVLCGTVPSFAQQTRPRTLEGLLNTDDSQKPAAVAAAAEADAGPKRPAGTWARPKNGVKHPDLDKAWAAYDAAVTKAAEGIRAAINKQFDAAIAKGDLDAAEKWQAALEQFEESGGVPTEKEAKTAVSDAVANYKKAREELTKVYEAVVKALTIEKRIDAARATRAEKDALGDLSLASATASSGSPPEPRMFSFDLRKPVPESVSRSNAAIHKEPFGSVTYWAPQETGKWATIAYSLSVPFPIGAIELRGVGVSAWNRHADVAYDPDAIAVLEASPDGRKWTLIWSSTPDKGIQKNDDWTNSVRGSKELHLQARLFGTRRSNQNVHHVQFLRSQPDRGEIPTVIISAREAVDGQADRQAVSGTQTLESLAKASDATAVGLPVGHDFDNAMPEKDKPTVRPAGTLIRPKDGARNPTLDKAWTNYDVAVAKVIDSIKAAIAKQFDAATARGALDAAEKWQLIGEKFEKTGELPAEREMKTVVGGAVAEYRKAKEEITKAYEAVVKSLTMEKKIAEAIIVRAEGVAVSNGQVSEDAEKSVLKPSDDLEKRMLTLFIGQWRFENGNVEEIAPGGVYLINGNPSDPWGGRWRLDLSDPKGPCVVRHANNGTLTRWYIDAEKPTVLVSEKGGKITRIGTPQPKSR